MLGIARIIAISSSCWCEPPSAPTDNPPCETTNLTLSPFLSPRDGYAIAFLI